MNTLKIKIMNQSLSLVDSCEVQLPEWVKYVTLEYGTVTGWDQQPQWRNGTFYADPLIYTEEFYHFKNEYELFKPYLARCEVTQSRGLFLLSTLQ